MEILVAIDRLDDLVHEARAIPLTDQVRLEKDELEAHVAAIRAEADRTWRADRAGPVAAIYGALERLEAIAGAGKPVPGTDQVRVKREHVYEQLDILRQVVPQALATRPEDRVPSPWDPVIDAVDAIAALMREAPRTPFTGRVRLDAQALRHATARVRTVATQNIGPPNAATGPFYAAVDDLEQLARADGTLKLSPDTLYDLLERLYLAMGRGGA